MNHIKQHTIVTVILACLLSSCNNAVQPNLPEAPPNLTSEDAISAQNIYSGTRLGGTTGARFAAYYEASVATYGYGGAMDNARASWNGISSNVAVDKSTTFTNANDIYYVSPDDKGSTVGQAFFYTSSGNSALADPNSNWHHTSIVMYNGTVSGRTDRAEVIRRCAIHEVGHSLKMDHDNLGTGSIMDERNCAAAPGVTTYNRNELIRKWGK